MSIRQLSICAGVLGALGIFASAASAQNCQVIHTSACPAYNVTNLGGLTGFTNPIPSSINDLGRVAGSTSNSDGSVTHAFRTEPNSPINPATDDLGLLPGAVSSYAAGINNLGQVVGFAGEGVAPVVGSYLYQFAFRADPGNPSLINLDLAFDDSIATGINNFGRVTGEVSIAEASTCPPVISAPASNLSNQAFLTTPNGLISEPGPSGDIGPVQGILLASTLGTLDGICGMSQGTAINNAGQVVGYSNLNGQQFTGPYHASIWTPSMGAQDLGTLGGPSATSIAYAINDPGQVVGSSTLAAGTLATGPAHAFLASPVTITLSGGQGMGWSMQDLGTLGGTNSYATAINNSGQIVGFSLLAGSTVSHAFIYQGGVMTDLNSLLGTAYTGWVLESANAINNYGQIVGTGTYCSPTVGTPSGSDTNCVPAAFRLDPAASEGAPSSGANCNGSYSATFAGDLKVSNGQICNFLGGLILGNIQLNGGSLSLKNTLLIGNVALQNGYATFYDDTLVGYVNMEGGSLNLIGSAFGGGMNIAGGYFSIDPSTILGNLEIRNLPTGTAISQICGLTLYGNLQLAGNAAPILVGQGGACGGNSIYGNTQIQNNAAAVTVIGNTVSGNLQVQNNSAPVSVIDNTVSRNLQCSGNTAITGNGNKVSGNKQGQCAAF